MNDRPKSRKPPVREAAPKTQTRPANARSLTPSRSCVETMAPCDVRTFLEIIRDVFSVSFIIVGKNGILAVVVDGGPA